jgi:hypothetical protein
MKAPATGLFSWRMPSARAGDYRLDAPSATTGKWICASWPVPLRQDFFHDVEKYYRLIALTLPCFGVWLYVVDLAAIIFSHQIGADFADVGCVGCDQRLMQPDIREVNFFQEIYSCDEVPWAALLAPSC